jgi:predicted dehydrogenase
MTASGKIRVGIIGVTPGRSWAAISHIPALRALSAYEIVAVANSNAASSKAAATAFGIPHAHSNAAELARDPDVDLVVVTVKVPQHKALVDAALDAGNAPQVLHGDRGPGTASDECR